jgi:hypothetical protein
MGWVGNWEAVEKQFQATASDLSQREFPLCGEGFGPLVKLVGELDLGAYHAVNPTSLAVELEIHQHAAGDAEEGAQAQTVFASAAAFAVFDRS